ncbi:alpha/beta fold hydrolase [Neobacillus sp. CF12]|uniref:alpha/beta fold hydrolase n=1 Tax=Neobacillus sp. CF12 TaxID=3055864 RepID=UPI0025A08D43|nr:alpha/beta fold hydrolase [Neobacillus sp. CF12]MDM5328320.1 alpha/beta fold hydrolase [Neobacillus sp. CF12]
MIIVEKSLLKKSPHLHIVNKSDQQKKLPLIIFNHGFTSAKEHNLHYAYLLAEKGFRIILPEAIYHGEREQGLNETALYKHFWEIVIKTIHELNDYKEYYVNEGLVDQEQIGLAGTSMGGMVTLGALTKYKWVKAAVSLMGMPAYEKYLHWQLEQMQSLGLTLSFTDEQIEEQLSFLRQYDLSLQPEKLENRPLLFWHGIKDPIVPYHLTYQFYQSIKDDYQKTPANIRFISDAQADHKVSREGLKATVEWFEKHLLK